MTRHNAQQATHRRTTTWKIFRVPAGLALISSIGLISALLGDGPWNALSWLALALPIAIIVWNSRKARL